MRQKVEGKAAEKELGEGPLDSSYRRKARSSYRITLATNQIILDLSQ